MNCLFGHQGGEDNAKSPYYTSAAHDGRFVQINHPELNESPNQISTGDNSRRFISKVKPSENNRTIRCAYVAKIGKLEDMKETCRN